MFIAFNMMFDSRIPSAPANAVSRRSALRAFGWPELTARINAARDLRHELSRDSSLMTTSFMDAAAGYFASGTQSKRVVNPNALEAGKACDGMGIAAECDANASDAREIND